VIQMNRRKLIGGLGLLIAAPAIVKAANIMRVKPEKLVNPCAEVLECLDNYTYSPGHGYKVGDLLLVHFSTSNVGYGNELRRVAYVDDKGFSTVVPPRVTANWIQL